MRKTRIATCLLLLLLVAATSALNVKLALVGQVAVQWGHLAPSRAPDGEGKAEEWICNETYTMFYNTGTWWPSNAYYTYTQLWAVAQVLQYCQNPNNGVTWATTWWVGDFKPTGGPDPFGHLGFYGHNGQDIYDYDVYKYANYYYWSNPYYSWWQPIPSKQYFDFIWTCTNGGLYWYNSNGNWHSINGITQAASSPTYPPPTNTNTEYGFVDDPYTYPPSVVGMPLAWTGTSDMSTDGYASPDYGSYCYVGWEAISPWMTDQTDIGVQYKWFPYYFYRCALGHYNGGTHQTIQYSLNFASQMTLGASFLTSKLYSGEWKHWPGDPPMGGWWYRRMRVFGNSNLILPY